MKNKSLQHTTTKDFTAKKVGEVFLADTFLNNEWPLAQKQDVAIVNLIDFGNQVIQKLKYIKIANNISTTQDEETVVNYGNWEKVETS